MVRGLDGSPRIFTDRSVGIRNNPSNPCTITDSKRTFMSHSNCSRRQMVRSLFSGSILMPAVISQLLAADGRAAKLGSDNPLAPKPPHFPAKVKHVIFIYLPGGCSHV